MIGLKRGTVNIIEHQPDWEDLAKETITELKRIFKDKAVSIEHVGSTAIKNIRAKPIIDIVVGVSSFTVLSDILSLLEENGYQKEINRFSNDYLYVIENDNIRTHQIHITLYNGLQWHNYVDFTKFMNMHPLKAKEYEELKMKLVNTCNNVQKKYTDEKQEYMNTILEEVRVFAKGH